MAADFVIEGQLYDSETDEGIPGLEIEVWDADYVSDDLVARATTDDDGSFIVAISQETLRRRFGDDSPELCISAFDDEELVLDHEDSPRWDRESKKKHRIDLDRRGKRKKRKHRPKPCRFRDIYLKIEEIKGYSPVFPNEDAHGMYRADCFRNEGHEDATIPDAEVEMRKLDALVYREYTDGSYTIVKDEPIVATDSTEPPAYTRVPGTVIYTRPGQRLRIHVLNGDDRPHSLHVHGLDYGVDSDGAWPLGVNGSEGGRSDEICPGETWTYTFDVARDSVGAWPFHGHYRHVMDVTNRGLFGGIVVRDHRKPRPDYEVPFFLHRMQGERGSSVYDSGTLHPGDTFAYTFPLEGESSYFCRFHPMVGTVDVKPTAPANVNVDIADDPPRFDPAVVEVAPGGTVTWTHVGNQVHTVTESAGAGSLQSFCVNGRTFVGNTPRINAVSGKRIRWYVFNLDFGMDWHNFHTHAMRWQRGKQYLDTESLGPAESFTADTIVPDVILPPCKDKREKRDKSKRERVTVCGDLPVHCHVEPHMMQGMAAVVHVTQELELTRRQREELGFELPTDCDPHHHSCREVELDRCGTVGVGRWDPLTDSPVFPVHAAVLHTGKVLLFSGRAEQYHLLADYPLESAMYDPATDTFVNQPFGENLFCAGHSFLEDGRLLVGGGDRPDSGDPRIPSTHVFDPATETWTKLPNDMQAIRWYPTLLTLADGRVMAASGAGSGAMHEIFDPATDAWTAIAGADRLFSGLYPSLHLLPSGEIFWSRTAWGNEGGTNAARLAFTGANSGTWSDLAPMEFPDRQEGAAVTVVDATVNPPVTIVYVIGGGAAGVKNPQSCEAIDVTSLVPVPSWYRIADLNAPRTNVNAVLLPDGKILAVGGQRNGKWAADPNPVHEAEIYDPATDTWTLTPAMTSPRQYHSVAVLLPDGRVLSAGGIDPTLGGTPARDLRTMEMFTPGYVDAPVRPSISAPLGAVAYGATFDVGTPDAAGVGSVVLLRPLAVTHHTDANQRLVRLPFSVTNANTLTATAPVDGNVAPPGMWMLFIVTPDGIASTAEFVQLS